MTEILHALAVAVLLLAVAAGSGAWVAYRWVRRLTYRLYVERTTRRLTALGLTRRVRWGRYEPSDEGWRTLKRLRPTTFEDCKECGGTGLLRYGGFEWGEACQVCKGQRVLAGERR